MVYLDCCARLLGSSVGKWCLEKGDVEMYRLQEPSKTLHTACVRKHGGTLER